MNSPQGHQIMPLTMLQNGSEAEVIEVRGGRGMRQRLSSMGVYPGQSVSLVHSNPGGPIIVKAQDTRVAIGRGMANRVMVKVK